jgi:hypothetical protein
MQTGGDADGISKVINFQFQMHIDVHLILAHVVSHASESLTYIHVWSLQIRHFAPCGGGGCDWVELDGGLQQGRWYASNQILPDGSQIVVGGRGVGTVEYVPAKGRGTYDLPLLYKVRRNLCSILSISHRG